MIGGTMSKTIECPVCNHIISNPDELIFDPCKHVVLTYVDAAGEFVHSTDQDIEGLITARYEHYYESDDCEDRSIPDVMYEYAEEHDGFAVIELTTYGFCCGPSSSTEYELIKLN
jgi:hypothetical protein